MYETMHFSPACKVDSTIYKKLFYENADLSAADEKLFTDTISKVIWRYSLKEDTCFIHPYKDELREYSEVEVIEVELAQPGKETRIAEIIMRTIPYPMLLILRCLEQVQLWAAHQRTSQNDTEKNVLEELVNTEWLTEGALLEILDYNKLRQSNFYVFYSGIVDAISVYNVKNISNIESLSGVEARALLAQVEELDNQITSLRAKMKKETQFNRKMELNMEIKRLERDKKELESKNVF